MKVLSIATTAMIFIAIAFLQGLADRHAWRYDLTAESAFTLSTATRRTLSEVVAPIRVTVFIESNDPARTDVDGLLREVRRLCPAIRYRLVDPHGAPALMRELKVTKVPTTVFWSPPRRMVVSRGCNEIHLLSGLRRLLATTSRQVCFLTGHGERDMLSPAADGIRMFVDALVAAGLEVSPLNLQRGAKKLPRDCGAVVVVRPTLDLLADERARIEQFLAAGGGLLVFADELPGKQWQGLFASFGLALGTTVVVDTVQNMNGSPLDPIITDFRDHPAVRQLEAVVLHGATPLRCRPVDGVRFDSLMYSARTSWGESSPTATSPRFDASEDQAPPLLLAVAAERTVGWRTAAEELTGRLLLVGDGDVVSNQAFAELSNADLGIGTVEWVAGYAENVIMLPKSFLHRHVYLAPGQLRVILLIVVCGMPMLAGACALLTKVFRQ